MGVCPSRASGSTGNGSLRGMRVACASSMVPGAYVTCAACLFTGRLLDLLSVLPFFTRRLRAVRAMQVPALSLRARWQHVGGHIGSQPRGCSFWLEATRGRAVYPSPSGATAYWAAVEV